MNKTAFLGHAEFVILKLKETSTANKSMKEIFVRSYGRKRKEIDI